MRPGTGRITHLQSLAMRQLRGLTAPGEKICRCALAHIDIALPIQLRSLRNQTHPGRMPLRRQQRVLLAQAGQGRLFILRRGRCCGRRWLQAIHCKAVQRRQKR
jgi:hypothetical protein